MRVDGNQGGAPNYFPNSFGGPEPTPECTKKTDCYYILCANLTTAVTNKYLKVTLRVLRNTAAHVNENNSNEMFGSHTSINRSTPPFHPWHYTIGLITLSQSAIISCLSTHTSRLHFLPFSLTFSWVARGPSVRWRHQTRDRTRRQLHTVRRFLQKRSQCSWEGKTNR